MYKPENVNYKNLENPDFPVYLNLPEIPEEVYIKRIEKLTRWMETKKLTHIIIYGDREHNANFSYFSGFDLSFEEGILIINKNKNVYALLGNECSILSGYKNIINETFLFQSFSLLGQPRTDSDKFKNILMKIGIKAKSSVGIIDWKYFSKNEVENPDQTFFIPHFIIENIAEITGGIDRLYNVTDILMHPEYGMRVENEVEMLAGYERAASIVSSGISRLLKNIKPGMSEIELGFYLNNYGVPLSCHKFIATGKKTKYTLTRPSERKVNIGDPFTAGFGVFGGLSCRAGYIAERKEDLGHKLWTGYLNEIIKPYFAAIANWYESIGIGVSGGEIYNIVEESIPKKEFGWILNPGHLIAEDEWINSSVFKNSRFKIKNGMALQTDIIPNPESYYHTTNVEDGVILMDKSFQNRMQKMFPDTWKNLINKKKFMVEKIGINLRDEVFPVSSIPCILRPFILEKHKAMSVK
jgi:hypothetical protein